MSNVRVVNAQARVPAAPNGVLGNGARIISIAWNERFPNEGVVLAMRTDAYEPFVTWNAYREHLDTSSAKVITTSGRYFSRIDEAYADYVKRSPA